jgi:hypothetical protein
LRNGNKTYPNELISEIEKALSYYPDLEQTHIYFRWGRFARRSFMLAQPIVPTMFGKKENRHYQIIMKKRFFIKNKQFSNGRIPFDVIVGWLGHELGHILDYRDRSTWNLMWFGFWYYFSDAFIRKAEITADKNAAEHGLIKELTMAMEFSNNGSYFPQSYIDKLKHLYPSIAQIRNWARKATHLNK